MTYHRNRAQESDQWRNKGCRVHYTYFFLPFLHRQLYAAIHVTSIELICDSNLNPCNYSTTSSWVGMCRRSNARERQMRRWETDRITILYALTCILYGFVECWDCQTTIQQNTNSSISRSEWYAKTRGKVKWFTVCRWLAILIEDVESKQGFFSGVPREFEIALPQNNAEIESLRWIMRQIFWWGSNRLQKQAGNSCPLDLRIGRLIGWAWT